MSVVIGSSLMDKGIGILLLGVFVIVFYGRALGEILLPFIVFASLGFVQINSYLLFIL